MYLFHYQEDGSKKLKAYSSCAWFIFILNTKISLFTDRIVQYLHIRLNPCHPTPCPLLPAFLLTGRTSFLARGANTHPLLSLVCYQLPTLCCFSHPTTPHRSSHNIYIDDINNISHPHRTQYSQTSPVNLNVNPLHVDN
jgi:hypothetical protein